MHRLYKGGHISYQFIQQWQFGNDILPISLGQPGLYFFPLIHTRLLTKYCLRLQKKPVQLASNEKQSWPSSQRNRQSPEEKISAITSGPSNPSCVVWPQIFVRRTTGASITLKSLLGGCILLLRLGSRQMTARSDRYALQQRRWPLGTVDNSQEQWPLS